MSAFPDRVRLGRSGLQVGPLAVSGGYGIDSKALLQAFDKGVNYWYHGSRRSAGMAEAIRELVASGRRDELVIVLQSYQRFPFFMERSVSRALKDLHIDHADVLLLGWHNKQPSDGIMESTLRMQDKGMYRCLAVSGHHRPGFVDFANDTRFSVLHIRYNAAHTGAEKEIFPHLPQDDRPGLVAYTATRWGHLLRPGLMPEGEMPLRGRDCYRFVLSNPDFNVCMTGPKNEKEMNEALAAISDGPLTPEENDRFRRIGAYVRAHKKLPF
jgi:aryl-alcohol dehydrogenase-like predicted oxidoreductase